MDCRKNHEDELKGIWQSWGEANKMGFRDKYGDAAQLLFVKPDDALLRVTRSTQDILEAERRFSGTLRYDQCLPAISSLNRVEASIQNQKFWKKLEEIRIK
ncbi:hypothetical protein PVK06_012054 [Gossypium arboreum]|uniref:Uncharacterized protein n=1 Tax=Gossypium arboreum TaxID=29729 RepID=A0ABR0QAG4_GOSAR|nr:hypothetical protein PVK06_012054 [Gossypium arboreum]